MTRQLIPIADMSRRLPEIGRIRTGVKTDRATKAIDHFRFTSQDCTALEQISDLYGGEVRAWSDDKAAPNQFEVITNTAEIQVGLPPDPLGGTPIYELWGGGGCERRCDGVTCETWVKGPEGPEPADQPCVCSAKGELACDPKTRLNVILPNVRGLGTWRLETKSWNAAQELPGMVEVIQGLQAKGITRAILRLEHKRSTQAGVTRKFIVPTLGLDASVEALVAGEAAVGRLNTAPPAGETVGAERAIARRAEPARPHAITPHATGLNEKLSDAKAEREVLTPEVVIVDSEMFSTATSGAYPPGWADRAGPDKARATKAARRLRPDFEGGFDEIDPGLAAEIAAEDT